MNKNHLLLQLDNAMVDLKKLVKRLEQLEKDEPEGGISVRHKNNSVQYYQRLDAKNKNGKYLRKSDTALIAGLSQKLFNHNLKANAEHELALIAGFIQTLKKSGSGVDAALDNMPAELREFVNTGIVTGDAVPDWDSQHRSCPNPIKSEKTYTTSGGEIVRSKSELIIAEALKVAGVPYYYEKPIEEYSGKYSIFPDFTCLNKRTGRVYYWEHFGRLDDPQYSTEATVRIQNYEAMGIYLGEELLVSFETLRYPIRTHYIHGLIEKYLI